MSGRFYLNKSRFYLKQRYIKQSGIMYKISLQNKKKKIFKANAQVCP